MRKTLCRTSFLGGNHVRVIQLSRLLSWKRTSKQSFSIFWCRYQDFKQSRNWVICVVQHPLAEPPIISRTKFARGYTLFHSFTRNFIWFVLHDIFLLDITHTDSLIHPSPCSPKQYATRRYLFMFCHLFAQVSYSDIMGCFHSLFLFSTYFLSVKLLKKFFPEFSADILFLL